MSDEFIFGSLDNGAYEGDELDAMERRYLQRDFARVQSPSGEINRVIRDSVVFKMLLSRGWVEVGESEDE